MPDHDDTLARLALELRCESCRAMPGHWCTTKAGHSAAHLHAARMLVVQSVFLLGVEHGQASGERVCEECGNDVGTYVVCGDCMMRIDEAAS